MCTVMAAAAGVDVAGRIIQGGAAAQHGAAVKAANERSAESAEQAADEAVRRGDLKDLQETLRGDAVVTQQLVQQSASGADVNVGAPLATRRASSGVLELSRKIVRRNATLEALGLREQARGYRQAGEDAYAAGKNAFAGSLFSAGASVIGKAGAYAADRVGSEAEEITRPLETSFNEQGL